MTPVSVRATRIRAWTGRNKTAAGAWRAAARWLLALALLAPALAGAQNLIANPGFENNPPPNNGNNIGWQFNAWNLGIGDQTNIVKVDGPGGYNYGTAGPQSDASNNGLGAGTGVAQHYADIVGVNDFYQTFVVPTCGGVTGQQRTVNFSGWFSRRDADAGSGTITIRAGAGTTGTVLGTASASIAASESINTWRQASGTATVTTGSTISFVVRMANPTNFDEAFMEFASVSCVSAPLTLQKTWSNAIVNDAASVIASRDGTQIDTLASVANSASETDVDATPVTVFQGQQIVLSETLAPANAAAYTASLACTGGGTLSGSTLTVNATGTPIACTFTNAGQVADLRITKTNTPGVNGEVDQAADTVTAGTTATYTIRATNAGQIDVTNAIVRDTATAPGLTGCAVVAGSCTTIGTATCPAAAALTYPNLSSASGVQVPLIGAGGGVQFRIQCNVQP